MVGALALAAVAAVCEIRVEPGVGALERARAEVRAARSASPGHPVAVTLAKGDYVLGETLCLTANDSGTAASPVVWKGEPGAVVRGGVAIGQWKDEGNGVVSAAIPVDADGKTLALDMLFVNGIRASRSVLPKNRGAFKIPGGKDDSWSEVVSSNCVVNAAGKEEWHVVLAHEFTRVGEDAAAILDRIDPKELPFVQMQVRLDWSQARRRIVAWDPAKRIVKTDCFGGRPRHSQYHWCDRSAVRFENVRTGFTEPGEWFCDDLAGKVLYRLRDGETAATLRAVAPARKLSKLLAMDGTHDIVFENLVFAYSDAPQAKGDDPAKHNQTWQGQSAGGYDAAVSVYRGRNVVFRKCRVEHSGNYGFRIGDGCRCVTLDRCETFDTGAGGVWLGADRIYPDIPNRSRRVIREMYPESCASNVVADCTFREGGRFQPEGTGVFVTHASDNVITHNLIDDFYYSGITVGYTWGYGGSPSQRNEISFNRISRLGQHELSDMGGIYTLATSFGTVVSNNVISEVFGYDTAAWGLYADEGSEGIVFENNVVSHTEFGGVNQHYGSGCVVRNNIVAYNDARGCLSTARREAMGVPSSLHVVGNIFYTHKGPLACSGATGVDGVWAHNVWWKEGGPAKDDFDLRSAEEFLASGRAYGDVVADPLFVDAKNGDFRLKPDSPALKLGFREWDFNQAGPRP